MSFNTHIISKQKVIVDYSTWKIPDSVIRSERERWKNTVSDQHNIYFIYMKMHMIESSSKKILNVTAHRAKLRK